MGFLDTVIKDSGNEFASIVSDGAVSYTHLRAHET